MVASILFFAMFMTRKRNYKIFASSSSRRQRTGYLDAVPNTSTDHLLDDSDSEGDFFFDEYDDDRNSTERAGEIDEDDQDDDRSYDGQAQQNWWNDTQTSKVEARKQQPRVKSG